MKTREEEKRDRFFDRVERVLPQGAVLIAACGVWRKSGPKIWQFGKLCRYLRCTSSSEAGSARHTRWAFFMPSHKIFGFRPPCGALMRPLPLVGEVQRESGTLFCFRTLINHFKALQK